MKNKIIHSNLFVILLAFLFLIGCSPAKKIAPLQQGDAFKLVDQHQFTFVADNVSPFRGRTRYLTSDYSITVNKDSLVSYLPFFGQATQAPMNPSETGIKFTSTDFSYKVVQTKNDRKEVTVVPNDRNDIQQLYFIIYDNGSATLHVTSTYRDPISFNGHLSRVK
ncbi:MAG: DUF4251 domain-containing protein [Ginsengibacter sp.]|jgi:hypothetical protein